MSKLLMISAFYRNNDQSGVAVSLNYEFGDLDLIMQTLKESYDQMWRESVYNSDTATLVQDLLQQLDALGHDKDRLDFKKSMMVIGNIYLLEKVGALKGDEFNGLQLIYDRS